MAESWNNATNESKVTVYKLVQYLYGQPKFRRFGGSYHQHRERQHHRPKNAVIRCRPCLAHFALFHVPLEHSCLCHTCHVRTLPWWRPWWPHRNVGIEVDCLSKCIVLENLVEIYHCKKSEGNSLRLLFFNICSKCLPICSQRLLQSSPTQLAMVAHKVFGPRPPSQTPTQWSFRRCPKSLDFWREALTLRNTRIPKIARCQLTWLSLPSDPIRKVVTEEIRTYWNTLSPTYNNGILGLWQVWTGFNSD